MPGSTVRRPAVAVRSRAAQPALLGRLRHPVDDHRPRVLRFFGGRLSARRGRAAMASDLWPIGADPLQRRLGAIAGALDFRQPGRCLGAQGADGHRHLHLRDRRGADRLCARRRLAALCAAALFCRSRFDGGGGPVPDHRRRADADPPSHLCHQLLRGVRDRRRAALLDHLGGIAGGDRLARHGHARRFCRRGRRAGAGCSCPNRRAGSRPKAGSPKPAPMSPSSSGFRSDPFRCRRHFLPRCRAAGFGPFRSSRAISGRPC